MKKKKIIIVVGLIIIAVVFLGYAFIRYFFSTTNGTIEIPYITMDMDEVYAERGGLEEGEIRVNCIAGCDNEEEELQDDCIENVDEDAGIKKRKSQKNGNSTCIDEDSKAVRKALAEGREKQRQLAEDDPSNEWGAWPLNGYLFSFPKELRMKYTIEKGGYDYNRVDPSYEEDVDLDTEAALFYNQEDEQVMSITCPHPDLGLHGTKVSQEEQVVASEGEDYHFTTTIMQLDYADGEYAAYLSLYVDDEKDEVTPTSVQNSCLLVIQDAEQERVEEIADKVIESFEAF